MDTLQAFALKTSQVFSTCLWYYIIAGVFTDGIFVEQLGVYINIDNTAPGKKKVS